MIYKRTLEETYKEQKTWGDEVWIENTPQYCGKILRIKKGKKGSLHFHKNKMETMYLQSGAVTIRFIDPQTCEDYSIDLRVGDSVLIPPAQVHQIIGVEDSELFEFSTTHENSDSYRVEKGSK